MDTKKVAAAIIRSGEMILLTRRKQGEKLAGYWEFPGGKVEDGESPQQTIEREIQEELHVSVKAGKIVTSSVYNYTHGAIELIAVYADIVSGTIQLTVHDKYDWVEVPDLLAYKLAPADIPIAEELIANDRENRRN